MPFLKAQVHQFIHVSLLCLIAFGMPFPILVESYLIVLLTLNWVLMWNFKTKWRNLQMNPFAVIYILFFFIHFASVFYSSNQAEAWLILEKKLSFFVLPLVIGTTGLEDERVIKKIISWFVAGCVTAGVICLGHAFYQFNLTGLYDHFFYHSFSRVIDLHSVYFSAYVLFAIGVFLFDAKNIFLPDFCYKSLWRSLTLCFLLLLMLLLSSKLMLGLMSLMLMLYIVLHLVKSRRFDLAYSSVAQLIIVLVFMGSLLSLFVFGNPVKQRFQEIASNDYSVLKREQLSEKDYQFNGLTIRLAFLRFGKEILDEKGHWLSGTGVGDTQDELNKEFLKHHLYMGDPAINDPGYWNYNFHNQYLQTMVQLGLGGLIILIVIILVPFFIKTFTYKSLFLLFNSIFGCFMLTESALEAQHGIVYFVFFSVLFMMLGIKSRAI